MTKDAYFEMCEMLGTEPDPDEIPVELDDLPDLVQQALEIYGFLPDRWEGMSATFLGKDYSIAFDLFRTYEIDCNVQQRLLLRTMSVIDSLRSKIITTKQQVTKQATKKPSK
jgi:hypothetical protein